MWTNDPVTGQYVPARGPEWGTTYTMQGDVISLVNTEQDAYLAGVAAVNASGWPDYPVATVRPERSRPISARDPRCTRPGSASPRCALCPPTCCRPGRAAAATA